MERVQVLIDKLVQQKKDNETAAQMLYTVQLLQTELASMQQKEAVGSRKVAVVMPANFAVQQPEPAQPITPTPQPAAPQKEKERFFATEEKQPEIVIPTPVAEAPQPTVATQQKDLFGNEAYSLKRPAVVQPEEKIEEPAPPVAKKEEQPSPVPQQPAFMPPPHPVTTPPPVEPQPFDALAETPTLLQHIPPQVETPKEINQLISAQQPSLNDRLKEERPELAHKLKEAPIKDLRKAIGINDRFVFVSELFRGDEVMYERSIKTINAFHILQEAEYWMNRELKVKLGWNDNKETVQQFYGLVRRRFS